MTDPELFKWALTQGGLVLVLLVVGWTYRRDFSRLLDNDTEKLHILTTLVATNTSAMERAAAASTAVERSVQRLSQSLDSQAPGVPGGRRRHDPPPIPED